MFTNNGKPWNASQNLHSGAGNPPPPRLEKTALTAARSGDSKQRAIRTERTAHKDKFDPDGALLVAALCLSAAVMLGVLYSAFSGFFR
jgi:hypothetical protein